MRTSSRSIVFLVLVVLGVASCSRKEAESEGAASAATEGDEAVVRKVQAAARALAQPGASVDYVAAALEGVIKARTTSQALIHFDGYRTTLTTPPGDRVTRITFVLAEAKPTVQQLTEAFGDPEEVGRGMLYRYHAQATGSTIRILAEPSSKPATETSLVRRILIEGEKIR